MEGWRSHPTVMMCSDITLKGRMGLLWRMCCTREGKVIFQTVNIALSLGMCVVWARSYGYMYTYVQVHVNPWTTVWNPKVGFSCLPQAHSALFCKIESPLILICDYAITPTVSHGCWDPSSGPRACPAPCWLNISLPWYLVIKTQIH